MRDNLRPERQSTWALYVGELTKAGKVQQEAVIRSRTDSRVNLWSGAFSDSTDVEVAPIEGFDVDPSDIVIMYRWLGTDAREVEA